LSEGSLDTGVEIDGHRVVATDFDLTPNEVEILSQELVQDRTFDCLDCSVDTLDIDEYYRLKTPVWLEANPADEGMLCIGCVEERLGRQLIPKDFPQGSSDAPSGSARLRSRLTGEPER
jgi:hypothetical protein